LSVLPARIGAGRNKLYLSERETAREL
jgi:hypothetical protein